MKAGNLIYVDPSLDSKVAGLALSKDDQIQVVKWIQRGELTFGGGHVLLPLLNGSIVSGDLVPEPNFLAT